MFDFKPHYEVALRADSEDKGKVGRVSHKSSQEIILPKIPQDSFLGFRSDFIHCGFSMHSPITPGSAGQTNPNSIHLTPRVFAHFWSLLKLFDNALALPIRQGKMWPGARPPSEKFGRHIATIKFRLCLDNLAISHTYKQDSQDSWGNGEVPSVGVKALVKSLRADLHQRDEEIRSHTEEGGSSKSAKYTRAKSLYGAELRMTDIYMRAVVAIFREPDLQFVVNNSHPDFESPYSVAPLSSINDAAFDKDDYTELDWLPTDQSPKFYMGEVASCPEFSFVKKIEKVRLPSDDPTQGVSKMSKFGSEPSHECIMGRELGICICLAIPCSILIYLLADPRQVQLSMATQRRKDLEAELEELDPMDPSVVGVKGLVEGISDMFPGSLSD
jgi:RNA pol II promoter Fmp27 protein domain